MTVDYFANGAETTLNGSINNSVTAITVTSATPFPATTPFRIRIKAEGSNTHEICTVTAGAGTTSWTVVRASESYAGNSSASAHASGATVEHVLTAGVMANLAVPATAFIGCSIRHSTTSSATTVPFDTELYDTDGFHDTVTNNGRVTIPAGLGGKYLFTFSTLSGSAGASFRFMKNGTIVGPNDSSGGYVGISYVLNLVAGDYVTVDVNSPGTYGHASALEAQNNLTVSKLDSGTVGQGIGARAVNSGSQAVSNATFTAATFDTNTFDTDGFHSTSSNTSRMTIPTGLGGKYLVLHSGYWNSGASAGIRISVIRKNGTTEIGARRRVEASAIMHPPISEIIELVAGDYIEALVYQSSGGNADLGTAQYETTFEIARLDSGSGDGQWLQWTPTVSQPGSLTITTSDCWYIKRGQTVDFRIWLKIGSSGTSTNSIIIGGQPAVLARSNQATAYGGPLLGMGNLARPGFWHKTVSVWGVGVTDWRLVLYDDYVYAGQAGTNVAFGLASTDEISLTGSIRLV